MTKKVCISGYYGFGNFGDEIILKILVENLKKFDNPPEITVFSSNPAKTSLERNVKSVQTFNPIEILKELYNSDCLISGGGSLLQDITSKKSLVYYLLVIFAAKIFRKKVIIFAQGIGPVNNKVLACLTRFLLKKSDLVTVRDENSLNLMKKWEVAAFKCSDPVWNISIQKSRNPEKIGIQLRDCPTMSDSFLENLSFCINKFYKDKEINILSLQNSFDLDICNRLKNNLNKINSELNVKVIESISNEQVIQNICCLKELIGMRYHACLCAIKAGVKVLPLSYDIKVKSLAEEFGLDYIDIENSEITETIFSRFINKEIIYDENKINSLKFNFKTIENMI